MTDRYERIRKALKMGPTPGPWRADGFEVMAARGQFYGGLILGADDVVVAQMVSAANAPLIAACDPDTSRALLDERDALEAENERLQAEIKALRAEVTALQHEVGALHMHAKQRDQYAVEKAVQALYWKKRAERLAEALRGWWKMRRPVGWTEDQHRSCPHVNLATDAEKALATALLRDQETTK